MYFIAITIITLIIDTVFVKNTVYSITGGVIIFALVTLSTIKDAGFKIEITDTHLYIINRGKSKIFDLNQYRFGYYIRDNSEYTLKIIDSNDQVQSIDCSDLGGYQFEEILNDLNVIGDDAPVYKVETIRKDG